MTMQMEQVKTMLKDNQRSKILHCYPPKKLPFPVKLSVASASGKECHFTSLTSSSCSLPAQKDSASHPKAFYSQWLLLLF